jgi:hypothetical protein
VLNMSKKEKRDFLATYSYSYYCATTTNLELFTLFSTLFGCQTSNEFVQKKRFKFCR